MIIDPVSARALMGLRRSNFAAPLRAFLEAELRKRRGVNETQPVDPAALASVRANKDLLAILFDDKLEAPK